MILKVIPDFLESKTLQSRCVSGFRVFSIFKTSINAGARDISLRRTVIILYYDFKRIFASLKNDFLTERGGAILPASCRP